MADRITVSGDAVVTEDDSTGAVTAHVDALEDASDGGTWETLKLLGFQEGDFVPLKSFTGRIDQTVNTTQSSYQSAYQVNEFIVNAAEFPGQLAYRVKYRARPNGDDMHVRLWNQTDSEIVTGSELTSSAGFWDNFATQAQEYSPTTSDDLITIESQLRNSDGTTEVILAIAQVELGVFL